MQAAGGSNAAAVGQGQLQAARTRNAGGSSAAIPDATRGAGESLSKNLLGIRTANAQLKQHQRDTAQSGLEGLFGTNVGGANAAQGNVAPLVNANSQAEQNSWDWLKPLNTVASLGSAAAGFYKK